MATKAKVYSDHQMGPLFHPQGNSTLVLRPAGRIVNEDLLWGNCPLVNSLLDPTLALWYEEEFTSFNKAASDGDWTLTQATAGSAAISTAVIGALTLDAGASTAHQGANLQRLKTALLPAAGKDLWFEVTVVLGTALTAELFLGLSGSNTTIITAGALTTAAKNLVGFSSVTGDGVMLFQADKAGTAFTPDASPVTLSLTVPHALGFFYDGTADTLQAFVDGAAVGSVIPTANISKSVMYPSLVCQSSGTTQPTMTVSALRVFQLR